ncbi:NUDIX domain-containing protein [Rhizobium sp. KVB221]|uniref:NUDIX domain-containing protein n=1 Tax=Rhizobium setariae TaxID=2801340 RepID=A0A937CPN8_9HYPH|nr:NUDIX domain-containing protein [Rhizobium setariae]MBL0372022.1 NUDIX domain-containing protein [Rhizobium setariae]
MSDEVTPPEMSALRYRILTRVAHTAYFFIKGMTIGVRAACFDDQGRIFLVRHSYIPGWHMPGGGVERGETVRQALKKELREEGNLELTAPAELIHVYFNSRTSKRDHVVFFRCRVRQTAPRLRDREIVESGFFALDALPAGTTSATLRRLKELSGAADYDELW